MKPSSKYIYMIISYLKETSNIFTRKHLLQLSSLEFARLNTYIYTDKKSVPIGYMNLFNLSVYLYALIYRYDYIHLFTDMIIFHIKSFTKL